jgi:hypothetical protein
MCPKEQRKRGQGDIFKSRLDQIVDMKPHLAVLELKVDRRFWRVLQVDYAVGEIAGGLAWLGV